MNQGERPRPSGIRVGANLSIPITGQAFDYLGAPPSRASPSRACMWTSALLARLDGYYPQVPKPPYGSSSIVTPVHL
jgi:hypothetical protein